MENTEGSEGTGTKISDSAYSNSCGNSQSHRSGSSKSRHSGSNSSGSSGYGGKGSSSATNSNDATQSPTSKRAKDKKNKKSKNSSSIKNATDISANCGRGNERSAENDDRSNNLENTNACINRMEDINVSPIHEDNMNCTGNNETISSSNLIQQHGMHPADHGLPTQKQENDNISMDGLSPLKVDDQPFVCAKYQCNTVSRSFQQLPTHTEGFSCVVSMCEGVVLYTNSSITHALGYPQDMWIGRSFIDFIHPKDRPIFGSQITSGVASAFVETSAAENSEVLPRATLYCRIRKYRGVKNPSSSGYGVREREVCYAPFQLNLSFKDATEFDDSTMYLVIRAYPVISPYADGKLKCKTFTTRHTSTGLITHVEPVALLGYLPQDIIGRSIFDFYHPDDLPYLKEVYENVSKSEKMFRSKPYRFCTQNGDFLTVESDWSTFINPWSRKLEFVISCHYILQAPYNLDVFQSRTKQVKMFSDEVLKHSKVIQDEIVQILTQKKSDSAKLSASKRCKNMAMFMERLVSECERPDKELKLEVPEDTSLSERDSVMLGEISPHHDYYDSKSSTETPPSYNQLNYNENLQRFFESRPFTTVDDETTSDERIAEDHTDAKNGSSEERYRNSQRQNSGSGESGSSGISNEKHNFPSSSFYLPTNQQNMQDYKPAYLTEEILHKHNTVMEKLLVKKHRDERSIFKAEERDKSEKREKKLSNLRNITEANDAYLKHGGGYLQGVKRSGSLSWEQQNDSHKVTKLSMQNPQDFTNEQQTATTTAAQDYSTMGNANTLAGMAPHIPTVMNAPNEIPNSYSGLYPAVYLISPQQDHPQDASNFAASNYAASKQYPVPYMMYPPTMFTSQPFLYAPHMAMAYQPVAYSNPVETSVPVDNLTSPIPSIGLPYNNYQQACQISVPVAKTNRTALRHHLHKLNMHTNNDQLEFTDTSTVVQRGSLTSPTVLRRATFNRNKKSNAKSNKTRNDLENDESSCSSYYSSFLKTETSNSTDGIDSGGEPGNIPSLKDRVSFFNDSKSYITTDDSSSKDEHLRRTNLFDGQDSHSRASYENRAQTSSFKDLRKLNSQRLISSRNPPWLDEVAVTPDLVYKYQVTSQNVNDILKSDLNFLESTNQPSLVNEQLSQLYMELQLDGLSQKLTLEEGITSNSSSEEESVTRRKRTSYSKLVMIHEEDAPIPPPMPDN